MRDTRYLTEQRGGPLDPNRHRLLATWAADCAERVLPLYRIRHPDDDRPAKAIAAARAWVRGGFDADQARTAGDDARAAAEATDDDAARYAARSAGHAATTAAMADHAPAAATDALRSLRASADGPGDPAVERERTWQREHLADEIRELVLTSLESVG